MKVFKHALRKNRSLTPEAQDERRGLTYALILHGLLLLALVLSLFATPRSPNPIQIELWAEGDVAIAENQDEPIAAPDEPEPQPEPEPTPTPVAPKEPEVAPEPPPTQSTPPEVDPDIALAEAKRKKEEEDRQKAEVARKAREEADRKAKEEADRKARAEAEQRARTEAERKAREEAEQRAKTEAERKAREEADQRARAEADRKAREEAEQRARAETERKAREETERKAREAAEQRARAEAQRKAREDAERKAREDAFRAAMLGDGQQIAGAAGGTANRNQLGGGGGNDGYGAQVRACVRPNVIYNTPARNGRNNPTLSYRADLNSDGTVRSVRILRSSGIALFDDAVQKGIAKCSPFPKPPNGRYPSYIDGEYRMYE